MSIVMNDSHVPDVLSANQMVEVDPVLTSTKPLKEFSKENAQTERDSLAHEIKASRRERQTKLTDVKKESATSSEILEKVAEDLTSLAQEIEAISNNSFSKLANFIKLGRLKKQLREASDLKDEVESKKTASDKTISTLSISKEKLPAEFEESKRKIEAFYQRQMEKWKKLPYEKSDVEKFFNKDYLTSLSLADYETLLARFSSNMVTHVTRQGVRDHSGMVEHSVGLGKNWNGFKELVKDRRLKHAIELKITEDDKEAAIARYFNLANTPTKESALYKLERFTGLNTQHYAGSFVDFHAVHFAVKSVANEFYGSESGNEIFIAYPSYVMASNYFHRRDPHVPLDGSNYNDLWVYIEEDDEMPVDAGVVFIPKNARVNPNTGSKYEIDEKDEALPDSERIHKIIEIIKLDGFKDFSHKARRQLGEMQDGFSGYLRGDKYGHEAEFEAIETLLTELKEIYPEITEEETRVVMNYGFLWKLHITEPRDTHDRVIEIIEGRLIDLGMYYKKSKTTISSEEYWERYFAEHPSQKPSKIVYYEGEDPTSALTNWQRETGQSYGKDHASIEENQLQVGGDNAVLPGEIIIEMQKFKSIAERVIDNFYNSN